MSREIWIQEVDRWATDDIVKRAVEKPLASEAERQEYVAWIQGRWIRSWIGDLYPKMVGLEMNLSRGFLGWICWWHLCLCTVSSGQVGSVVVDRRYHGMPWPKGLWKKRLKLEYPHRKPTSQLLHPLRRPMWSSRRLGSSGRMLDAISWVCQDHRPRKSIGFLLKTFSMSINNPIPHVRIVWGLNSFFFELEESTRHLLPESMTCKYLPHYCNGSPAPATFPPCTKERTAEAEKTAAKRRSASNGPLQTSTDGAVQHSVLGAKGKATRGVNENKE